MAPLAENIPGRQNDDGVLLLQGLVFARDTRVFDLEIKDACIDKITPASGPARWLCLPPLADLHVHANRAYTRPTVRPKGLEDAIQNVAEVFSSFKVHDYARQARIFYDAAVNHGTTIIRTHADIDSRVGLDAVAGSLRAAEAIVEHADVDVIGFAASNCDPAATQGQALLRDAVSMGAGLIGAVPAFCPNPEATIDAVLDLAIELSIPADFHLDEHLDPDRSYSEYLADATLERGLQGLVTLSHGCAISALTDSDRQRTIDKLAKAQITVIALPRTNLFLQDRGDSTPQWRGVTNTKEMLRAGVAVRFASDNVQDCFYPYGDADMIGVALDAALATQIDDPETIVATICNGRFELRYGDAADFVLIAGKNFDVVLAEQPKSRWICRRGNLHPCLHSG